MQARPVLFVSVSALLLMLLCALVLNASGGTATAQGPNPLGADSAPATAVPLAANGDGQLSTRSGPAAPELPTEPDSPANPALSFSYYKVIGSAFQPRNSTSTYAYTSNGCIYQNGGTDFRFQHSLVIPEDSEIKYVRIYYIDTAATDMTVWLTRYEPGQANLDLTSVSSSGSGGYGTVLSPLITQTVDMATYAYVLTWGTSVATSANQICGVRVAYYKPLLGALLLPFIQKNP